MFRYTRFVEGIFDSALARCDSLGAFETALTPPRQRWVIEDGVGWVLRVELGVLHRSETVRSLSTFDVMEWPLYDVQHPLFESLEQSAAARDWGGDVEVRALEVMRYQRVVETVQDPSLEVSLADAQAIDPECVVGDELGRRNDEQTRALREELIHALRRHLPVTIVEESASASRRLISLIERAVETSGGSEADLATALVQRTRFWTWPRTPAATIEEPLRKQMSSFVRGCLSYLEAVLYENMGDDAFDAFDSFNPPDMGITRTLFDWLQRHRRRDHFGGRRR